MEVLWRQNIPRLLRRNAFDCGFYYYHCRSFCWVEVGVAAEEEEEGVVVKDGHGG
jgi:hypothetical protein